MGSLFPAWCQRWMGALRSSLLAVVLCSCLFLSACSGASTGLSGNYLDDTVAVADVLLSTIALGADDPGRPEAETQARSLINNYVARYRPRSSVNGLASFTTMQTAMNSLAGHYTNYPNRPLPDALRERLTKELNKAEVNVARGA
ncbi:photosystem II protein Psb27 [Cyanobium sp. WAJ14-Wanaka]|uniref:photosystem II protein Psb27 n=1 Tax=Cyanobium sp. WAJ14-Wanaka TaxID=2823725 RepID=UPI0020CE3B35|nr:photosystem II protein Psb27 [Cyanobium sp. WAJ14-Wanaka]